MNIWNVTIEIIIGLLFLFIIVVIVGRKIISQVTPFTFIAFTYVAIQYKT